MDAKSGAVLESREADLPLPPASVAKAVTSLYALDKLGAGHRFATRVLATGPVEAGMVQGDVILAGGGDPTLQTDQLGDLVARLAKAGLRGATGRFLYWDGALPSLAGIAEDQPPHVGYNAAVSGLNLNFNRVHFEWKRDGGDWRVAVDARGERFVPEVGMVRVAVAQRDAPLFTYAPGPVEEWTVASAALGKGGSRWLPVRGPGAYVAEVFRTLARAQGIRLDRGERVAGLPAGHGTGSGRKRASDRGSARHAEIFHQPDGGVRGAGVFGSADAGGIGAGDVGLGGGDVRGHSRPARPFGLGGRSRVTARAMAQVLQKADAAGRGLKPILRDVGMKDDKGEEIEGHPVTVVAKSGTLNFVSGLAGHVSAASAGAGVGVRDLFGRSCAARCGAGFPARGSRRGAGRLDQAGAALAGAAGEPLGRGLRLRASSTAGCQ